MCDRLPARRRALCTGSLRLAQLIANHSEEAHTIRRFTERGVSSEMTALSTSRLSASPAGPAINKAGVPDGLELILGPKPPFPLRANQVKLADQGVHLANSSGVVDPISHSGCLCDRP